MKYWVELLYLLCILKAQSFAVGETKSINDDISEEIHSCDYTRFETQLERLNLQAKINHDALLRQQMELFNKMDVLSLQIRGIETKLLEKHETERQVQLVPPPANDKILVMTDIREKLKEHDNMLAKILNQQNDTQELCKKIDLEDHTQTLKNTISDKMVTLQKIDAKITDIESNLMPKNISGVIINNQNSIQNLLKEMNLEGHTQTLKTTISDKFDLMQKIGEKLTIIGNNSIPKNDQLKFYQDIQQHLTSTEKYLKGEQHGLITNNQSYPTSCADVNDNYCVINKCLIKNHLYGPAPFYVACNNSAEGGGWTVIQRRIDGAVDFYREWSEYKSGFCNLDGEFFIGLDKLHALTSTLKPVELLILLEDFENVTKYAKYDDFQVGNETENYTLIKVGSYVGDAGNNFSVHVGYNFSTKDRDNDIMDGNCAISSKGAWWYSDCYYSNLNGKYYQDPTKASKENGISWRDFHGYKYSLKFVQMSIRPRKL